MSRRNRYSQQNASWAYKLGVLVLLLLPATIWGEDARRTYLPDMMTFGSKHDRFSDRTLKANEECCTDPGAIAGCWWKDAERDGVVCNVDADCGSSACIKDIALSSGEPPNGWGLCGCETSDDCNDGICRDGICGPSYCNGFLVCACWGGCDEAKVWGYGTPNQACSDTAKGFPGLCCEGTYASSYEGVGSGYCSDTCPDPETPECENDTDCNDIISPPLSQDCTIAVCAGGFCETVFVNTGDICTDSTVIPDPAPSWHSDCSQYQCTETGLCELTQRPTDTLCDDADICTLTSLCDADGKCQAETPDATDAACCNPTLAATFDDNNPCTTDSCSSSAANPPFRDINIDKLDGTACNNDSDRRNDACGFYACENGNCTETYTTNTCRDDEWTTCLRYVCSDLPGEEGECVAENINEGTGCEWLDEPNSCGLKTCQSGACDYELAIGETGCTPQYGSIDACCEYVCDSDHQCSATCAGGDSSIETCPGSNLGALDENDGTMLTVTSSNRCAADDYSVDPSGRFNTCNVIDDGETVHYYEETTHLNEYQLRHTEITLIVENWSPILYTAKSCEESGDDTQSEQYTCSLSSSPTWGMTGPWPLADTPDVENENDVTTANTHTSTVIVDARTTESPSGGEYTLDLEVVEHDNDSCINTGDSVNAPHLTGGNEWKLRYLGNVDGYENFFYDNSIENTDYCWNGGAATEIDPKYAFYYLNVPYGTDTLSSGDLPWQRTYKLYTDPLGTGNMSDVLSFYGDNIEDGDCSHALGNRQICRNETDSIAPREMVFEYDSTLETGIAAISNRNAGESGDYELNLLRVPRPFIGMAQQFAGPAEGVGFGSDFGCSCSQLPDWTQSFNLIGHRLDFIPTNNDVTGYAVRKTVADNPYEWLVEIENRADTLVCEGPDCTNPSGSIPPFDMTFQFPYAGELWSNFCVDAAGRAILANGDQCDNQWYPMPNADEFIFGADIENPTPSIAPLWGSIVPCNQFSYPGCSWKWYGFIPLYCRTADEGDLNCETNSCSSCVSGRNCDVWKWNEKTCQNPGRILKELRSFEGTSAMVITWEGFDGQGNPRNAGPDHGLNFQVILRVDGRITFYYKMPLNGASDISQIMNVNGWMVGLSGGRSLSCDTDSSACDATGTYCDNEDIAVSVPGESDPIITWQATEKCMKRVNFQTASDVPVSGTWQGE